MFKSILASELPKPLTCTIDIIDFLNARIPLLTCFENWSLMLKHLYKRNTMNIKQEKYRYFLNMYILVRNMFFFSYKIQV